MKKLKDFYIRFRHGIPALVYMFVYLLWFTHLEKKVTRHYQVIHMKIDDYIPFCEVFIIPYLLWFAYVAVVILYLLYQNKYDFYKCCIFLFTGMTVFLVISTLCPNGHHLRPAVMPRDNVFTQLISKLYQTDTATNLWPSIHVYNSIGCHLAVANCDALKKRRGIRISSFLLCVSIILSTVLIKQHSVFDMLTAFIMAACMYVIVYHHEYSLIAHMMQHHKRKKHSAPQVS